MLHQATVLIAQPGAGQTNYSEQLAANLLRLGKVRGVVIVGNYASVDSNNMDPCLVRQVGVEE